jgi:hypothetical protein
MLRVPDNNQQELQTVPDLRANSVNLSVEVTHLA